MADSYNQRIRRIAPDGRVTTVAGGGGSGSRAGGFADGQGAAARFGTPEGLTIDANGNVYVADSSNNRIRLIAPR